MSVVEILRVQGSVELNNIIASRQPSLNNTPNANHLMCNDYIVINRHRDGEVYMDIYCTANVNSELDTLIRNEDLFHIAANKDRESWVTRILDFIHISQEGLNANDLERTVLDRAINPIANDTA